MRVTYPVIFTETDDNILIEVPDLKLYTEANAADQTKGTIADAIYMARDTIGMACIMAEDEGREVVPASSMGAINITEGVFYEEGSSFVSLVDIDIEEYRKRLDNRMVRRNVTLPNWLNREAEKACINVSKVLQEALMMRLSAKK